MLIAINYRLTYTLIFYNINETFHLKNHSIAIIAMELCLIANIYICTIILYNIDYLQIHYVGIGKLIHDEQFSFNFVRRKRQ